jgi:type 1 fimbriae regulatory protein FimB/type 1 fimbriae regulatory protein FimE
MDNIEPFADQHPAQRRAYVTEDEVDRLIAAAKTSSKRGASGERDATMILVCYTHGLRVSELVHLQWRQLDLDAGRIEVIRLKGSENGVQPLRGVEIRALRKLRRSQPADSRFVFTTDRGGPMTRDAFYKLFARVGRAAGITDVHPHLLRHGTGFRLVNQGLDTLALAAYLGHRQVQNTKRYAKMNATRFDGLWKD